MVSNDQAIGARPRGAVLGYTESSRRIRDRVTYTAARGLCVNSVALSDSHTLHRLYLCGMH